MIYLWKCNETGAVVEHGHPSEPPVDPLLRYATYKRVFSFGVGRVSGAGEAPSRPS